MTKRRSLTAATVFAAVLSSGIAIASPAAAVPGLPSLDTGIGLPDMSAPVASLLDSLPAAQLHGGDATDCKITRTGEYQKSSPEAVGLDSGKLKSALNYATANGSETIKVFRHGCLVGEGGLDKVMDRIPRQNWSHTKTVSALVAGVAERQGLIKVDDTIDKYLPKGLGDAKHRAITVRSILNMTTGAEMNWVRGLNLFADISRPREVLSAPMRHQPETYFEYDQTTPSLLNYVVQQALIQKRGGMDYQEYAQRELFNKLGIPKSAYWWQRDRSGNTLGYSQMFLRPLEFGRFGELMLNEGKFQDKQVINASYLKDLRTGSKANCGYGYMVWINSCSPGDSQVNGSLFERKIVDPPQAWIASAPKDMYYAWGLHGQHTFVIPSLDMVITRSGELQLDAIPGMGKLDGDAVLAGQQKEGYFNLFRKLMGSIKSMPAETQIAQPTGAWQGKPDLLVDPDTFIYPMDSALGSYLAVGNSAPEGCTMMGCEGDKNDGMRWITDVPRTIPGVVGMEERPNG